MNASNRTESDIVLCKTRQLAPYVYAILSAIFSVLPDKLQSASSLPRYVLTSNSLMMDVKFYGGTNRVPALARTRRGKCAVIRTKNSFVLILIGSICFPTAGLFIIFALDH
jgi:hypothetical protein